VHDLKNTRFAGLFFCPKDARTKVAKTQSKP
jgi:hypothetical protein